MGGLSFDMSVRFGDIITIMGMACGFVVMTYSMRGHLKSVQAELVELRKVVIAQARADERLDALERAAYEGKQNVRTSTESRGFRSTLRH